MSNKYFVTKSAISFAGIDKDTYLTAVGMSDPDIAVDKLISNNCISSNLNSGYFDNSNNQPEFKGSINVTKESHEGQVTFDGYKITSSAAPITAILPGTSPHFNKKLIRITSPGTYTITRTATSLKIGSNTYSASDFVDGVIPLKLIAVLQGAGGGGGQNHDIANGSGGGSGGCAIVVINLVDTAWSLTVGAGGEGGTDHSGGEDARAPSGGATFLNSSQTSSIIIAYGGLGGWCSEGGDAASGGAGGTTSISGKDSIVRTLATITGAPGGQGAGDWGNNSSSGGTLTNRTVYCSRASDLASTLTLTSRVGGTTAGNSGGGGAASFFGSGGDAPYGEAGKAGGIGAGGGGSCWGVYTYYGGGKGGNGMAEFYY